MLGSVARAANGNGVNPVVFAAIGDYGNGSGAAGEVAMLVNGWSPDFIIGAGDNR